MIQVREMAAGANGSRPPVVDTERDNVVPSTIVFKSISMDGMRAEESKT